MRKVDPRDEIPVTELTPEAQKVRAEGFAKKPRSMMSNAKSEQLETMLHTGRIDGLSDKQILAQLNDLADQILQDEISPHSVCRKGCGICCRLPVHVTATEAKAIAEASGQKLKKLKKTKLIKDMKMQDDYCPFFDTDACICSVYEARPLTCRLYASLEHYEYCEGTKKHMQTTLQVTRPVNFGFGYLSQRLQEREKKGRGASAADIRYWFSDVRV